MNEIQKREVERVKDNWARSGCMYREIVESGGKVYMVLMNGTALSIDENGGGEWVVEGWRWKL